MHGRGRHTAPSEIDAHGRASSLRPSVWHRDGCVALLHAAAHQLCTGSEHIMYVATHRFYARKLLEI